MAKINKEVHQVNLTSDEAYTMLLLLGKVAGDYEAYNAFEKLSVLLEMELTSQDYDKVNLVSETGSEDWYVRIEKGED